MITKVMFCIDSVGHFTQWNIAKKWIFFCVWLLPILEEGRRKFELY